MSSSAEYAMPATAFSMIASNGGSAASMTFEAMYWTSCRSR
ncbi:hypothetical protein [Kitasatospora sp. NPDC056531]